MAVVQKTQLKTGKRVVRKQEKSYRTDEDLFKEDDKGNEMFIIQDGEVAILKNTDDGVIELAKLQKGTMIGEMALLDNMPRSATVRAVKPTKVVVINRMVFEAVLAKVPLWLRSIVKIVSSRLRDANTHVGKSLLRDFEGGLAGIILLLLDKYGKSTDSHIKLSYIFVKQFTSFTSRMSSKDFKESIVALAKRKLISVDKDSSGSEDIYIEDLAAIKLFIEYKRLKAQGKDVAGSKLSDENHDFLTNVAYVSQKSGQQKEDKIYLPISALDFGDEKLIQKMIGVLEKSSILEKVPAGTYDNEEGIFYTKKILTKVKKIKTFLPLFEMKI